MSGVSVLIVDDEQLARDRLRRMLDEATGYEVVAEAAHGKEGIEKALEFKPEIVLLDIRMPGMDGLEAARHLSELESAPAVIFCTAYDEYALEAFEVSAIGYVLKPVRQEQLLKSLKQACKINPSQLEALHGETAKDAPARTHIAANTRNGLELIELAQISHFFAEQKYITVHFDGREAVIEDTLKNLEQEFAGQLLRVHRNCLVSIHAIEALQKDPSGAAVLALRGVEQLVAVSRRHLSDVKKALKRL